MYHTLSPKKTQPTWLEFSEKSAHALIRSFQRSLFDMDTRMRILTAHANDTLQVERRVNSESAVTYWGWYADTLRVNLVWVDSPNMFNDYPVSHYPIGLFTSAGRSGFPPGGVESTIGIHQLYNPILISLDLASYEHADIGMLEGFIAILSAAIGVQTAFIGDERYSGSEDRSVGESFSNRYAIEQTEAWWRMWNNYVSPRNSIQSLVGIWHKDELVSKVHELAGSLASISSCHAAKPGKLWCGDCWKCYLTKCILTAKGLESTFIELSDAALVEGNLKYQLYLATGEDEYRSCGVLSRVGTTC